MVRKYAFKKVKQVIHSLHILYKIKKRRSVKRPIAKKKLALKKHMITLYPNLKRII